MSKASEWAKALSDARALMDETVTKSPDPSPAFLVSGFGPVFFSVSDEGWPVVNAKGSHNKIIFADDIENFRRACRWVLDTFGEEPPR